MKALKLLLQKSCMVTMVPSVFCDDFFLQQHGVFIQVTGAFSKFRPRASTYHSYPDSCQCCHLAYGTALFGPIECKQLLLDVSCVSVHSRYTSSHMAGAYTHSFFEIRGP